MVIGQASDSTHIIEAGAARFLPDMLSVATIPEAMGDLLDIPAFVRNRDVDRQAIGSSASLLAAALGVYDHGRRLAYPGAAMSAPCRVEFFREYTIPPFGSTDYEQLRLTEAQGNSYFEMTQQLQEAYDPPINRVLGYPDQVQGDVKWAAQMVSNGIYLGDLSSHGDPRVARLEKGVRDWVLLFQMDSDSAPGMMWGDEGRLYFTIKEADLKAGKFENVWCELQCG